MIHVGSDRNGHYGAQEGDGSKFYNSKWISASEYLFQSVMKSTPSPPENT